jgi:hypothetical protein
MQSLHVKTKPHVKEVAEDIVAQCGLDVHGA